MSWVHVATASQRLLQNTNKKNRQGTQQEEVIGVKKILVNPGCSKEPHFNQVFVAGCGDFYTQARPALGTEVGV